MTSAITAKTTTFTREYLKNELLLPDGPHDAPRHGRIVISNEITDHSRWSVSYTMIFRLVDQPENEAWMVDYSVGATETQDEEPWENEDTVSAMLVRQVERVVKVWEMVPEPMPADPGGPTEAEMRFANPRSPGGPRMPG